MPASLAAAGRGGWEEGSAASEQSGRGGCGLREEKGDSDIENTSFHFRDMALSLNIDSSLPAPCPQSFEPKILV